MPAHAMIHDHKVDLKDPRIKQVSSGFFDSSIVDASDNFARATPSTCQLLQLHMNHSNC